MPTGGGPLQFVLSSSVRADILRAVADGTHTTDALLADLDASSSAVYSALGRLEDASLLEPDGDDWLLTGSGQLVADFVERREGLDLLLEEAAEYLATHATGSIPQPFRDRMSELAGVEILEATDTTPRGVVTELTERLEETESADILTPIYDEAYRGALPAIEDSRVVFDEGVLETAVDAADAPADVEAAIDRYADEPIRITPTDFALVVTDDALWLSLPTLSGGYDARTEFVVETEQARQWGRDVFEVFWAEATPLEPYVRDRFL